MKACLQNLLKTKISVTYKLKDNDLSQKSLYVFIKYQFHTVCDIKNWPWYFLKSLSCTDSAHVLRKKMSKIVIRSIMSERISWSVLINHVENTSQIPLPLLVVWALSNQIMVRLSSAVVSGSGLILIMNM